LLPHHSERHCSNFRSASFQVQGRRMLGLIKADLASTGKPHFCNRTPSLFLNFRALNALFFEGSHLDLQIVAHEIKFVGTTLIGRVDCGFSRRQGENQPAMTCIHGFETEDIAEEGAVGLGILTVDNYVSAGDHLLLRIYFFGLPLESSFNHGSSDLRRWPYGDRQVPRALAGLFATQVSPAAGAVSP